MTSLPSARPRVSFITWPMITPIAFMSPAAQLLRHVGIGVERRAHDRGELVGAADGPEALRLDDLRGIAALGDERVEDLLRGALRDGLGGDEPGERWRAPRA